MPMHDFVIVLIFLSFPVMFFFFLRLLEGMLPVPSPPFPPSMLIIVIGQGRALKNNSLQLTRPTLVKTDNFSRICPCTNYVEDCTKLCKEMLIVKINRVTVSRCIVLYFYILFISKVPVSLCQDASFFIFYILCSFQKYLCHCDTESRRISLYFYIFCLFQKYLCHSVKTHLS